MEGKELRATRKQAKAFLKQMRHRVKEARMADEIYYRTLAKAGISPAVNEALLLLEDENVEFSADLEPIRQSLANLMRIASLYPTLHGSLETLADKLLGDGDGLVK